MFDFSDDHKNPFMFMMNMNEEDAEAMESFDFGSFSNPMMFMQQAFMMQMQMAAYMFMMPLQMMKSMAGMVSGAMNGETEEKSEAAPGTIKIGNFNVSPEMLQKLMAMDMSPENLEKLQKVLDFTLGMIPDKKAENDSQEVKDGQ
ncbi:MAG: hypothetical protein E7219_05565 [Clostridiales bacterium]|jgi:hypothetical protein|nr:hypothetical protein [Clostridiales bacterium]